jgi:hypothetical protein
VGQWAGSTPLKKAKYTIVVYSIGEFISSHLAGHPHSELGKYYTLGAGHDPTAGAAGVLGALEWPDPVE